MSFVVRSIPKSSNATMISIGILSGPVAFPFFILFIAALTSSFRIDGPSMFFFISGFVSLSSLKKSSTCSDHLFNILSFPLALFHLLILCSQCCCI